MAQKKRRKQRDEPEVPVEAFSDIAFLLLTFFLIVSTLQTTQGIEAEFPAGEKSTEQSEDDKTTTVKLHDNRIIFGDDDENITLDELRVKLKELKLPDRLGADKIVLLESSGKVPYANYFPVVVAINKAGGTVAIVQEDNSKE